MPAAPGRSQDPPFQHHGRELFVAESVEITDVSVVTDVIHELEALEALEVDEGEEGDEVAEVNETDELELVDALDDLRAGGFEREEETETRELHTVVCGYRIGPVLGRGGLSVVFEVTHPVFPGALAMKVVTDPRIQDDLAANAIYIHAKAVATLDSRHVVRTFDAGRLPSGEPFVVMERLDGDDLQVRLQEHGPLPVADAVRFVLQACEALAEAHELRIVHGDIKPGNMVVARNKTTGEESIKIVDFAPSVPRRDHPNDPLVTCSPGYASPEQLGARTDVDGRADVWALGAVLYELVTGQRAFDVATLPEMLKVIGRVPASMKGLRSDVPATLDIIVRRCLARDREARFENAQQLGDALMALHTNEAAEASFRAAATARASKPKLGSSPRPRPRPSPLAPLAAWRTSRVGRNVFLAMLGPACALLSMTLVRMVMASHLVAAPAPTQWPAPAPLAPIAQVAQAPIAQAPIAQAAPIAPAAPAAP